VSSAVWGTTSVWTWRFEPVSCLCFLAVTFYRILNLTAITASPPQTTTLGAPRQRVRLQSPYGLLATHPLPPIEKSTEIKIDNTATTIKNHAVTV